jgi:hypothetical protein
MWKCGGSLEVWWRRDIVWWLIKGTVAEENYGSSGVVKYVKGRAALSALTILRVSSICFILNSSVNLLPLSSPLFIFTRVPVSSPLSPFSHTQCACVSQICM